MSSTTVGAHIYDSLPLVELLALPNERHLAAASEWVDVMATESVGEYV